MTWNRIVTSSIIFIFSQFFSSWWIKILSLTIVFDELNRYGLPFVSPNNTLLTVLASIGGALEAIYVLIFLIFAPKKEKFKISGILFLIISIFSIVALVSVLTLHDNKRKLLCGLAFAITCIMMFGAPLTIMVTLFSILYINSWNH